jgi:glycosyltransferase involved in cell wall biosynthesis
MPRLCIQFSERLAAGETDWARYFSIDGKDPQTVSAEARQICIDGLAHGKRYEVQVRAGLPSAVGGEKLLKTDANQIRSFLTFLHEREYSKATAARKLASFDVCVLPYLGGLEANRGTYATARAHGLPIVTTTTGASRFDAESGTAFVRAGDPPALVRAILEAGRRSHRPQTDPADAWRSIAVRHVEVYRSLLGSSSATWN